MSEHCNDSNIPQVDESQLECCEIVSTKCVNLEESVSSLAIPPGSTLTKFIKRISNSLSTLKSSYNSFSESVMSSITGLGETLGILTSDLTDLEERVDINELDISDLEDRVDTLEQESDNFDYRIGEHVVAEGGVVFHRWKDTNGENYLILDPMSLGTSVWSNIDNQLAGASSLTDGLFNSNQIVNQSGHTNSAASLALSSTANGQLDWYLPSTNELQKVFDNLFDVNSTLEDIGGDQIFFGEYWTSTENITTNAVIVNDISIDISNKSANSARVRAIRKLTI
mgnify:CR=1 FL=1